MAQAMVSYCAMYITVLPGSSQSRYWYKALHLFYAGLYAFVLPFICWGAQATPGHPHARAHFVFVDPPTHEQLNQHVMQTVHTVADWLAVYGKQMICSEHSAPHTPAPVDVPSTPAGRSTPSQLAIATLILLGMGVALLLFNSDGPGFAVWTAACALVPCRLSVPTPPPR
ncbi:MAG: hypothetical protein R3E79_15730 [Caldilineaceae bacterium]